jgi:hypothetical protein
MFWNAVTDLSGKVETWAFLWAMCIGVASPFYLVIIFRNQTSKLAPFLMIEIPAIAICFSLWRMDPRGIEAAGYFLLLVVGPLTVGWTSCGLIEAIAWIVTRRGQLVGRIEPKA